MANENSISFSITREESEQLEREYKINDILYRLYEASGVVGGNTTINDAIKILQEKTRFADEVKNQYINKLNIIQI